MISATVITTEKRQKWDTMLRNMAALDGLEVHVGVFEDQGIHPESHTNIVDYATRNEFGGFDGGGRPGPRPGEASWIHPRPLFQRTFDMNRGPLASLARAVASAASAPPAKLGPPLTNLRVVAVAQLQAGIDTSPSWAKPNAGFTEKRKGFNHPLKETGMLRASIRARYARSATSKALPASRVQGPMVIEWNYALEAARANLSVAGTPLSRPAAPSAIDAAIRALGE